MKALLVLIAISCVMFLSGCPGKVDPGVNKDTKFGEVSKHWGLPLVHATTAGFNGALSEPNNTGPAEGSH